MKALLVSCFVVVSNFFLCQQLENRDLQAYNDFGFKIAYENEIVAMNKNIEALIIIFKSSNFDNAKQSILNNPQLKELKLFYAPQEFIDFISESNLKNLTHLFVHRYKASLLDFPPFQTLEHLSIESNKLTKLNMKKSTCEKLFILDIEASNLILWQTNKTFPQLGILSLDASLLQDFPIENMPMISQLNLHCSLKKLPEHLCDYKDLLYISVNNFHPVEVNKCFIKKISKGVYSNITIYDSNNGKVIFEALSKDRKN